MAAMINSDKHGGKARHGPRQSVHLRSSDQIAVAPRRRCHATAVQR